jgi:hypothetical protein
VRGADDRRCGSVTARRAARGRLSPHHGRGGKDPSGGNGLRPLRGLRGRD